MQDHYKTMDKRHFFSLKAALEWIEANIKVEANINYSRGVINYLIGKDGNIPCWIYFGTYNLPEQIETMDVATDSVVTSITINKVYENFGKKGES